MRRARPRLLLLLACACAGAPVAPSSGGDSARTDDGSDGADSDGADGADGTGSDGGDGADGVDGADGADGTGGCDLAVGRTHPPEGSGGGHYRSTVSFWTGTEPADAAVALAPDGGAAVEGAVSSHALDGGRWRVDFAPSSPLSPLTVYTATLTACGGAHTLTFQTDGLGGDLDCSPADRTYALDLAGGRWMAPDGGLPLEAPALLLSPGAAVGSRVDLVGAVAGADGGQDACWPTNPFTGATWAPPHLSHGPRPALLPFAGALLDVDAVTLAGDVRPDCAALDGVMVSGTLDLRAVAEATGTTAAALCDQAAGLRAPCAACGDGEVACVVFRVEDVRAPVVGGALTCVDQLGCHPDCAESACDDPTLGVCE